MKTNEKITIYYFSATGNSLKASMDIASQYAYSELVKVKYETILKHPDGGIVGFVFPVYMGGLPDIMQQFLSRFPFQKEVYYFAIGTYYTYKGIALSTVSKTLANKGVALNYGNYIPTVGNCLMEYEVSDKKRTPILKQADRVTVNIINDITNGKQKTPSKHCLLSVKFHKWVFDLFFKNVHKKFSLEKSCIGCGICTKVCPMNNIHLQKEKPQWDKNCVACHACVHWCPKNAINIGRSKGRLQYHNPAIRKTMLFTSK